MNNGKRSLEDITKQMLHDLGVPAHIKGYQYLTEAITIAAGAEDIGAVKVNDLYKQVAKLFQTTSSMVERAIRHGIKVAWDRGSEELRKMFPNCNPMKYPTSRAFIILLAETVQLKNKIEDTAN